jgi:hypothetical protein
MFITFVWDCRYTDLHDDQKSYKHLYIPVLHRGRKVPEMLVKRVLRTRF